jgi:hypothetical protein
LQLTVRKLKEHVIRLVTNHITLINVD